MDFDELKATCAVCQDCDLCKTRKNTVFGIGNPCAEVMLVGEAPGRYEDESAMPFVGRSGKLLDIMLKNIDLYRDKNIFITNIVKCRPPENRDPTAAQWDACIKYLYMQYDIISPKIVVCLGRIAAQRLIKPDFKIMTEHGQWFKNRNTLFIATPHPSALLRNPNNTPLATADYEIIKAKIKEICISTY